MLTVYKKIVHHNYFGSIIFVIYYFICEFGIATMKYDIITKHSNLEVIIFEFPKNAIIVKLKMTACTESFEISAPVCPWYQKVAGCL